MNATDPRLNLKNPPITETWIEFHLQSDEDAGTWNPRNASAYFTDLKLEFPILETRNEDSFEIVDFHEDGRPNQLLFQRRPHFRALTQNRGRCVQIAENVLVYNLMKGGKRYEGFEVLLGESIRQWERYAAMFRPKQVDSLVLHYTDVINLPPSDREDHGVHLSEYFQVGVRVPHDEKWTLSGVQVQLILKELGHLPNSSLTLEFGAVPSPIPTQLRFKIEWHATCNRVDSLDVNVFAEKLRRMHDALIILFQECFAPRAWQLFQENGQS